MKRISVLLIVPVVALIADTYLVRVEVTGAGTALLVDRGFRVVCRLANSTLLLVDECARDEIGGYKKEILAKNPVEGEYYLVYDYEGDADLGRRCEVLTRDGVVSLVRTREGAPALLKSGRVEIVRLSLTPVRAPRPRPLPEVRSNPLVQQIVNLTSADTVLATVRRLQNYRTRFSTHDSCFAAALWIANKFSAYGCDSVFFQYHTGGHAPNVIAIKKGVVYPESIYAVIDGHFDSYSDYAPPIAPGADDNASGVAATLEACRVMRNYFFEYTAVYIAFSGEEFGLYGSEYYASHAQSQGDEIIGVINGDMIGYADALPEDVEVLHDYQNYNFADFFVACADTYTNVLTSVHEENYIPSDIQPFYDNGYPGICTIEDYFPVNPHYHKRSDTIGAGYNNNAFATEVAKAEIAALAVLVRPYSVAVSEMAQPAVAAISCRPNPFTRRTGIAFTLSPADAAVDVEICDAAGRIVKTICRQAKAKMPVTLTWNGCDRSGRPVATGVYFVKIKAGTRLQTLAVVYTK